MAKQRLALLEQALDEAFKFGIRVRQVQKEVQDGIDILSGSSDGSATERKREILSSRRAYRAAVNQVFKKYQKEYAGVASVQIEIDRLMEGHRRLEDYMKRPRSS